jgi:hypothetical protein
MPVCPAYFSLVSLLSSLMFKEHAWSGGLQWHERMLTDGAIINSFVFFLWYK